MIAYLFDHAAEIEDLLRLPFRVAEVTRADISASHWLRRAYGLFINDSINLACAARLGIADLVTHDSDFNRAPNITVWQPLDI